MSSIGAPFVRSYLGEASLAAILDFAFLGEASLAAMLDCICRGEACLAAMLDWEFLGLTLPLERFEFFEPDLLWPLGDDGCKCEVVDLFLGLGMAFGLAIICFANSACNRSCSLWLAMLRDC